MSSGETASHPIPFALPISMLRGKFAFLFGLSSTVFLQSPWIVSIDASDHGRFYRVAIAEMIKLSD